VSDFEPSRLAGQFGVINFNILSKDSKASIMLELSFLRKLPLRSKGPRVAGGEGLESGDAQPEAVPQRSPKILSRRSLEDSSNQLTRIRRDESNSDPPVPPLNLMGLPKEIRAQIFEIFLGGHVVRCPSVKYFDKATDRLVWFVGNQQTIRWNPFWKPKDDSNAEKNMECCEEHATTVPTMRLGNLLKSENWKTQRNGCNILGIELFLVCKQMYVRFPKELCETEI
jgi:hypothetical protein